MKTTQKSITPQFERRLFAEKLLKTTQLSGAAIADLAGVHRRTVYRLKARGTANRKVGSGRKSVLTVGDKITITKHNKEKLGSSVRGTQKALALKGRHVGVTTIRRYIKQQPWSFAYKPQKTPCLTDNHKKNRVEFAQALLSQGYNSPRAGKIRMGFVMFTDESPVHFFLSGNRQNTRYRAANRSAVPDQPVVHSGGGHVMVCGGLTARGLTKLFFIPEGAKVNGQYYRDYILPHYASEGKRLYGNDFQRLRLMEDGARCHIAAIARKWVADNWPGDVLFPRGNGKFFWPGNSPDLNPIENLWAELKRRLARRERSSNRAALVASISKVWDEMNEERIWEPYVFSFGERLVKVVNAQGGKISA